MPPICNLSVNQKYWGGLVESDTLPRNTPPLQKLVRHQSAFASLVLQKLRDLVTDSE